jgi:hypothetical protein
MIVPVMDEYVLVIKMAKPEAKENGVVEPIKWNLEAIGIKCDPDFFDERARLAGLVDSAGLTIDYAYDLLAEHEAGRKIDLAFRRAIRALEALSKALEDGENG